MSYTLIVRPEAEADMTEAFDWYEDRKAGLGHEFLAEVRSVFRQVEENPLRYGQIYRKARSDKAVSVQSILHFERHDVEIIGVVHAKRDPRFWQRRTP